MKDAQIFIEYARLFKPDSDYSKPSIVFEEFILAMAKIAQIHGMKAIDQLIEKYKAVFGKRKEDII